MSDKKTFYGLPEEEFLRAKEAMELAYKPRDENDNILSSEALQARGGRAYFPARTPPEEGLINPITVVEDFSYGKQPEGFHYEPGQLVSGFLYQGAVMGRVKYDNPIYNMEIEKFREYMSVKQFLDEQEERIRKKQEAAQKNVAEKEASAERNVKSTQDQHSPSIQIFRGNVPVSPVLRENRTPEIIFGDLQVYEYEQGMYVKLPEGEFSISNFSVCIRERRRVYTRPDVYFEEYSLDVTVHGHTQRLTIPASSISMALKIIQKEIPACTVFSSVKSANKYIENVIREQTLHAKGVDVIRCAGFIHIRGRWIYVHDNATPPMPDMYFETEKNIFCDVRSNPKQAFLDAFQFLQISRKLEVILCLFLVAHLGPMFELFKAAGCLIRFVTALVGPSGSLKTAVVTCLYNLFGQQVSAIIASFLDSVASIELSIAKATGCVKIIDDLRPPVTSSESSVIAAKAEQIFRILGDGNSKGRSSPSLQQRQTPAPACCALITGEDIFGSHSSLLRCLILRIDKGDFDGGMLRHFQNNPGILQTHLYHFLHYCGLEGDAIVRYIKDEFPHQRALFCQCIQEPRLVDTAATLQVMAQILLNYARSIGAFTGEYLSQLEASFRQAIMHAVELSEASSQEMNPVAMYLRALFDMIQNGSIVLAPSAGEYHPAEHIGYIHEDIWWLRNRDIYPKVTQYWNRMGVTFPLTERNILSMMANNHIIEVDYEKTKKLYSRKSSAKGQPRMMVLNVSNAQDYLHQELGEF